MIKTEIAVIGGGPAGLCAAIEASKSGASVLLIDENSRPGGQLFKQIHKFFGSREHQAGVRGIEIGRKLLKQTEELDIEVWLNSEVCGLSKDRTLWVIKDKEHSVKVAADRIIIATGAVENSIYFPGWELPGVMGAGAAQTMINVNRVLPGKKVLMVGSGNVGVIVSYQLLQAGAEVVAVIDAAPKLGGYGVHTAKVSRAGVPFYTSHTVLQAKGSKQVEEAVIVKLDENWQPVAGSEKTFEVDTICIATGLTPLTELAWMIGCGFEFVAGFGGHIPIHNRCMETTIPGVYVAGDVSGIEEASTAMDEGRIAGINAAASLGYIDPKTKELLTDKLWARLNSLRCGPFGEKRKQFKNRILKAKGGKCCDTNFENVRLSQS